jgi:hypothetical protein
MPDRLWYVPTFLLLEILPKSFPTILILLSIICEYFLDKKKYNYICFLFLEEKNMPIYPFFGTNMSPVQTVLVIF